MGGTIQNSAWIAEALDYIHNGCPKPIVHRDINSSNILLNDEVEPQLSDFELTIWGPTAVSFLTDDNIVGTFGYLAPEYFMYGKARPKLDSGDSQAARLCLTQAARLRPKMHQILNILCGDEHDDEGSKLNLGTIRFG